MASEDESYAFLRFDSKAYITPDPRYWHTIPLEMSFLNDKTKYSEISDVVRDFLDSRVKHYTVKNYYHYLSSLGECYKYLDEFIISRDISLFLELLAILESKIRVDFIKLEKLLIDLFNE